MKIHVVKRFQLDWDYCIPAHHTQDIPGRYQSYTVLKVYDGSYCP